MCVCECSSTDGLSMGAVSVAVLMDWVCGVVSVAVLMDWVWGL